MKKRLILFLISILMLGIFGACGDTGADSASNQVEAVSPPITQEQLALAPTERIELQALTNGSIIGAWEIIEVAGDWDSFLEAEYEEWMEIEDIEYIEKEYRENLAEIERAVQQLYFFSGGMGLLRRDYSLIFTEDVSTHDFLREEFYWRIENGNLMLEGDYVLWFLGTGNAVYQIIDSRLHLMLDSWFGEILIIFERINFTNSIIGSWELVGSGDINQVNFEQWRNSLGGAPIELNFYDDGTGFWLGRGASEEFYFQWTTEGDHLAIQYYEQDIFEGITYYQTINSMLEITNYFLWGDGEYDRSLLIFERTS